MRCTTTRNFHDATKAQCVCLYPPSAADCCSRGPLSNRQTPACKMAELREATTISKLHGYRQPSGGCNAAGPWRTAKLHGYRDGGSPLRLVSVGCPRTKPSAAAAAQVQLR